MMAGGKMWTEEEKQYLIANYESMTTIEIGKALGRTRKSISGRATKLGIKKTPLAFGKVVSEARKAHKLEIARLHAALENCRLLAARHRKEDWALSILRFCTEVGVAGSITR